jgi:hypothetical protein
VEGVGDSSEEVEGESTGGKGYKCLRARGMIGAQVGGRGSTSGSESPSLSSMKGSARMDTKGHKDHDTR